LGAGNHFLEIQEVEEIYDKEVAEVFGLEKGKIVIMIHCGSRGLGHQVASDYIKKMEGEYGVSSRSGSSKARNAGRKFPDRELVNAPLGSELGKEYLSAMNCAVNYAFCNRQLIMHFVRDVLKRYFPKSKNHLVYDVCHNIAKFEDHVVDGKKMKLCVHRKGATRSFGEGRKEIPKVYRDIGQPVIIPGSMGTASYILVGTKEAEEKTFGSTSHGAGRVMSRSEAIHTLNVEDVKKSLEDKDVLLESGSRKGILEEAPQVYKDIDEVIKVSCEAGLTKAVVRLKPLAVIKG
jgi:tRNA-splicing ligase RtcB